MITLSNYLHTLFTSLAGLGQRDDSVKNYDCEGAGNRDDQRYVIHSAEFSIPFAIYEVVFAVPSKRMSGIGLWLEQQTTEAIAQLLAIEAIIWQAHARLREAIAECSRNVQSLLEKTEVAVGQAFLDYAQTVLAAVWDDYQQEAWNMEAHQDVSPKTEGDHFTRIAQQLGSHLRHCNAIWKAFSPPEAIHVTVRSEDFTKIPAHLLTHLKLLMTGDSTTVQGLATPET